MTFNPKTLFNIFLFTCILFTLELLLGALALWVMIDLFNMKSSLVDATWFEAKGLLSMHIVQLGIRYIMISSIFSWFIFNNKKLSLLIKALLNFCVVTLHMLMLGFLMSGIWGVLFFYIEIPFGLSIWLEVAISSLIMAFLFERYTKNNGASAKAG